MIAPVRKEVGSNKDVALPKGVESSGTTTNEKEPEVEVKETTREEPLQRINLSENVIRIRELQLKDQVGRDFIKFLEEDVVLESKARVQWIVAGAGQMTMINGCLHRLWWPGQAGKRSDTRTQL